MAVCPRCNRAMDDHRWYRDGKALPQPECTAKVTSFAEQIISDAGLDLPVFDEMGAMYKIGDGEWKPMNG